MRYPLRALLCIVLGATVSGCAPARDELYAEYHRRVASVGELDDATVLRYIRTYRRLRQSGINYYKFAEEHGSYPAAGAQLYDRIVADVKKGGFRDYAEFVKVNAKVAWAWNLTQAERGLDMQERLQRKGQHDLDQGIAQIDEALADPNVPAATKAELRKTRAELKGYRVTLRSNYSQNMKWARFALRLVRPLTNEKELAVIRRHEKGLMEVYTGLSREQIDQIQDQTLRQLRIE